jgi:hypothetical protein
VVECCDPTGGFGIHQNELATIVGQVVAVPEAGPFGIPVWFHPFAVNATFGGDLRLLAENQNCDGDAESVDQGRVPNFDVEGQLKRLFRRQELVCKVPAADFGW